MNSDLKPIHLVIPMSGQGVRYLNAGYTGPKPLIPINGIPMIEKLLSNMPTSWPLHCVLASNHLNSGLPELLTRIRSDATISSVEPHKLGPGHAILHALKSIPDDDPVLVSYCDYGMVWDAAQFERFVRYSECDACVVSYRGFHAHYLSPVTYAYSNMMGERVVAVKEKGSWTDNRENEFASCGAYYFRSASLLRQAIEYQVKHELQMNGEFYTSLTVEACIRMKPDAHVRVFEIPGFFQWGTPEDLRCFEYWEHTFSAFIKFPNAQISCDNLLMPMAGLGSRFTGSRFTGSRFTGSRFGSMTSKAKPLISIMGKAMFLHAVSSLPSARRNVFVSLSSVSKEIEESISSAGLSENSHTIFLPETPSGQALSTEAGLKGLGLGRVIVSSCDHSVVIDPKKWTEFSELTDVHAAIFTIKGFPGTIRNPQSFAYVKHDTDDSTFPRVTGVSVKQAISSNPAKDPLLVGTFWFKNSQILEEGIQALKDRNVRVNKEMYLDSIFEILIEKGYCVRIFPLDGYINWGDPDSLAEGLYWYEQFVGHRLDVRSRYPGVS